ncbi:MAG: beta-propeller domain-containing protein [Nannocystaceae bacterium]
MTSLKRTRLLSLPLLALFAAPLASGCTTGEPPEAEPLVPRTLYAFDDCDDLLDYAKQNAKQSLEEFGTLYSGGNGWFEGDVLDGGNEDQAGDTGGEGTGGGEPGVDYSETNVQELGVDEPDLVKTDGERIIALADGKLHHIDATGTPQLTASLQLDSASYNDAEMFLYEDRVLIFERVYGYDYDQWGEPGIPEEDFPPEPVYPDEVKQWFEGGGLTFTRITEVDISDANAPAIVAKLYVSGDYLSARRIDGVSRIVIRSMPSGLDFKSPYEFYDELDGQGEYPQTEEEWEALWAQWIEQAKAHNTEVIDNSTLDNWVPHYVFEDVQGGKVSSGLLTDCADTMHPGVYSGLTMTSVLTVDLEQGLSPEGSVGLFADGAIVYASTDNLYIATREWFGGDGWGEPAWDGVGEDTPTEPIPDGSSSGTAGDDTGDDTGDSTGDPMPTDAAPGSDPRATSFRASEEAQGITSYLHKFAIPADSKAIYTASGEVRGRLLSQWSMNEARGDLRVATTDQLSWDSSTWESFVSVLREEDGELVQVGQVGELGKGEEIKAVRYIGDVGYVVTFRQTDPLYTVDLSDHQNPQVAGELKINGYSAYLHPLDATHLIGVGFDGTDEGQLLGVQVSLFDVSDIYAPVRTDSAALGDFGWTEAAFDHHAFLYWEPTQTAVFPVDSWTWDEELMTESYFSGAAGYTIDPEGGIEALGTVTHIADPNDPYYYGNPSLRRSLVIGNDLYTVSQSGLKASALSDLSDLHWIEW